jgi:hypothetical protein
MILIVTFEVLELLMMMTTMLTSLVVVQLLEIHLQEMQMMNLSLPIIG